MSTITIHRYQSGEGGIFANAYLVETAGGVVAVDATLTEVYPGHGVPGKVDMLDWEKAYLVKYRAEVAALAGGRAALTEQEKAVFAERMKQHLPTRQLEFLIGLGADAVAAELAASQ